MVGWLITVACGLAAGDSAVEISAAAVFGGSTALTGSAECSTALAAGASLFMLPGWLNGRPCFFATASQMSSE